MSSFATTLDIREVDEFAGTFQLLAPLIYISDLLDDIIVVPKDFITDFASVPRLPFAYLVFGGKGNKAAVVHDWLYSCAIVSREQADDVLAEALRACGYGRLVTGPMWAGVHLFGQSHWNGENVPQEPHVAAAMLEAP